MAIDKVLASLMHPTPDAIKYLAALFVQGRTATNASSTDKRFAEPPKDTTDAAPSAKAALGDASTDSKSPPTEKKGDKKAEFDPTTPLDAGPVYDVDNADTTFFQTGGSSVFGSGGSTDFKSPNSARRFRGGKPFIVGLIPPDIPLDFVPVDRTGDQLSAIMGGAKSSGDSGGGGGAPGDTSGVSAAAGLPDSFYRKLADVAKAIGASPADLMLVLFCESGLRSDNTNYRVGHQGDPNYEQAKGLNQITPVAQKVAGMTPEFWKNEYHKLTPEEQLPYVQKYFQGCYKGPYTNPTQLYIVNFAPAYVAQAANPDFVMYPMKNPDGSLNDKWVQNKGVNPNGDITCGDMAKITAKVGAGGAFLSHLKRLEAVVGKDVANAHPAAAAGGGLAAGGGAGGGGAGPATVVGGIMQTGNITDTEQDDPAAQYGRNIQVASAERLAVVKRQTDELKSQIQAANNVPAVIMLVNPSDFGRSYEHTVDTPKGRRGPVVQMWMEKPLSISCKGVTAAQYAYGPDPKGKVGGGVTHQNRLHSLSYANLMSLVLLYRNNGHLYGHAASGDPTNWGVPVISMSVYIYYDGHVYIGSFDDFSLTDDGDKPYNMSYSWKFTARYDIEVAGVDDSLINLFSNAYGAVSEEFFAASASVGQAVPDGAVPPQPPAADFPELPKPSTGTPTEASPNPPSPVGFA